MKRLGVEAVFCSPYFQSVPGSPHGYNVVDPNQINPEIGTEFEYNQFCKTIDDHQMKQILDVVPNHMGIAGSHNQFWMDVLKHGPSSSYSYFFDVQWQATKKELRNKVLLPILGDFYGRCLERGEIQIMFKKAQFCVRYYENCLPLHPKSYRTVLGLNLGELSSENFTDRERKEYLSILSAFKNLPEPSEKDTSKIEELYREEEIAEERLRNLIAQNPKFNEFIEQRVELFNGKKGVKESFNLLDSLLNEQCYRLAYWKVAGEEINYRRFFDVNELAALRMEDDRVFDFCHQLVFKLVKEGKVHGLRIDHPDGLYDPAGYFRKLQEKAPQAPLYVVLEKILDRKETLPGDWNVHGTVGYEFLNLLNGLFVDSRNEKAIDDVYYNFIGHKIEFEDLIYERKKLFASVHMSSEINTLGALLNQISESSWMYRDFTLNNLTNALREIIACFPVYRTYISWDSTEVSARDEKYIRIAVEKAKSKSRNINPAVYEFILDLLLLKLEPVFSKAERDLCRHFILRFQQLSAPVMAKGLEDTAFYVDARFISLNEVGGDPKHFGNTPADFHRQNAERKAKWPYSFITSSTHDNKRSEDVRARLNVLSEIPEEWKANIAKWSIINQKHKTLTKEVLEPRKNTEYFIYQTLLGAWPNEAMFGREHQEFQDRMWSVILKSIREAKTYTSWTDPDADYESAVKKFLYGILAPQENEFLQQFIPFQKKIAHYGMLNSISALVLKIGSPGVMDTYQGDEIWNYCLVDPDNRRPVNYAPRIEFMTELSKGKFSIEEIEQMIASKEDGRIKLYTLWKGLNLRSRKRDLFLDGDYVPLEVRGEKADHVIAFARKTGKECVVIAATRFHSQLESEKGEKSWGDTQIILPNPLANLSWRNILTEEDFGNSNGAAKGILAEELFKTMSAAILTEQN